MVNSEVLPPVWASVHMNNADMFARCCDQLPMWLLGMSEWNCLQSSPCKCPVISILSFCFHMKDTYPELLLKLFYTHLEHVYDHIMNVTFHWTPDAHDCLLSLGAELGVVHKKNYSRTTSMSSDCLLDSGPESNERCHSAHLLNSPSTFRRTPCGHDSAECFPYTNHTADHQCFRSLLLWEERYWSFHAWLLKGPLTLLHHSLPSREQGGTPPFP
jgi:hypothetical protein